MCVGTNSTTTGTVRFAHTEVSNIFDSLCCMNSTTTGTKAHFHVCVYKFNKGCDEVSQESESKF